MIKLNKEEVIFEKFPNKEMLLRKFKGNNNLLPPVIDFKYEDDSDLIKLMILSKSLKYQCILNIMYMPYSRMDRGSDGICFTLRYICEYINWLDFKEVNIYEPHSDVTTNILNNSKAIFYTIDLFEEFKDEINADYILFPDKGAYNRYNDMFAKFNIPIINGNKKRDFATSKIEELKIKADIKENSNIVIIDDLCSYGGTFILAANILKQKGANNIYLIITHAEESILKGKIPESNLIKTVFTTNSIINKSNETTKIKIKEII